MNYPISSKVFSANGYRLWILFFTLILGVMLFPACKKTRVQSQTNTTALGYTNASAFHTTYQQQEQVFAVDSPGTGPIIGHMGTKFYPTDNIFMYPNGTNVYYPFTLKVFEIYGVKDVILSNLPPVAGGHILESKAAIRARAFKGSTELVLKPGRKFPMETATVPNMLAGMSDYYGFASGSIIDWTNNVTTLNPAINPDTLSSVTALASSYSMNIALMGWVDCARLYNNSATTTSVTFAAAGNNPQNIEVYMVFNTSASVMQVYSLHSGQIPIGVTCTVIAIAMDANNALVYDKQTITVTSGMTVTLNPVATTDANLLTVLGAL
jgi:hypothetical protein